MDTYRHGRENKVAVGGAETQSGETNFHVASDEANLWLEFWL